MSGCRALLLVLALAGAAGAHQLDEYQQAALVTVEPGHVELQICFIPGVLTADAVLAVIDGDHDGLISSAEGDAYAARVQKDLRLQVDGTNRTLVLVRSRFPSEVELKSGLAAIRLDWRAEVGALPPGPHHVAFQNSHWPALGVYLANAVVPQSPAIEVVKQTRGPYERSLRVDYRIR